MVDEDKCVNCHQCISACPVKFCNDGSGNFVTLNPDLCIGCGNCIDACTHNARYGVDDFDKFLSAVSRKEKMVGIVAPAIAANFPDKYLNLNGWFRSLGIDALFDVSFGAELTIKSYLEAIKQNDLKTVIAQPCPAIVTYIEIYQPELLPYLAPADSPMLHSAKMIKEYFPEYRNHKIVVISPCYAKRREFDETGIGDYNITYQSIDKYLNKNNINLLSYPELDFYGPSAERATLFSSPGGLMRTAAREVPDIFELTRKIEGVPTIYHYLSSLMQSIQEGVAPLIVDCLNCEAGCNGGTGTLTKDLPIDKIENLIEKRKRSKIDYYSDTEETIGSNIDKYWKNNLYGRTYKNLQENNYLKIPNESQLDEVFKSMKKFSEDDIYNCSACGYNSCKDMAIAIFNGLNKPQNCHHFNIEEITEISDLVQKQLSNTFTQLLDTVQNQQSNVEIMETSIRDYIETVKNIRNIIDNQNLNIDNAATSIGEFTKGIELVSQNSVSAADSTMENVSKTEQGIKDVNEIVKMVHDLTKSIHDINIEINSISDLVDKIASMTKSISDISMQSNLLALNASVEAARAGNHGKGFAIVANEVKLLSEKTASMTKEIDLLVEDIRKNVSEAVDETKKGVNLSNQGNSLAKNVNESMSTISDSIKDIYSKISNISEAATQQSSEAKMVFDNTKTLSMLSKDAKSSVSSQIKAINSIITSFKVIRNITNRNSDISSDLAKITESIKKVLDERNN